MDFKTHRYTEFELLHPIARQRFRNLEAALTAAYFDRVTKTLFKPFETYRHPVRQNWLKDVQKTSKASAFESPHGFGLAVDFVAYDVDEGRWSWDAKEDWRFLKLEAERQGLLVPISWDRVHVEHPLWMVLRAETRAHGSRTVSKKTSAEVADIFTEYGVKDA